MTLDELGLIDKSDPVFPNISRYVRQYSDHKFVIEKDSRWSLWRAGLVLEYEDWQEMDLGLYESLEASFPVVNALNLLFENIEKNTYSGEFR